MNNSNVSSETSGKNYQIKIIRSQSIELEEETESPFVRKKQKKQTAINFNLNYFDTTISPNLENFNAPTESPGYVVLYNRLKEYYNSLENKIERVSIGYSNKAVECKSLMGSTLMTRRNKYCNSRSGSC